MMLILLLSYLLLTMIVSYNLQKTEFSIKDFFSKCDQIRSFLRVWSHLLKESLMENFIFLCSVKWKWGILEDALVCC